MYVCVLNQHYIICLFYLLEPSEAQHVYSIVCNEGKVSCQPSHECSPSNKQVVAVYDLPTGIKEDDATL